MNWLTIALTPVVGAVIGYFTNWLAIKMLFRPHEAKYIGRFKLPFTPGLIPKERTRLTKKVAQTVENQVLTPEVLSKELVSSLSEWNLPDITLGELLEQLGVSNLPELIKKIISDTWHSNETTITEAVPRLVTEIREGLAQNPQIDSQLENLVRSIIDKNFSRLMGIFIDHKKIYASIKEGLFEYALDTRNQSEALTKFSEFAGQPMDQMLNGFCEKISNFRLTEAQRFLTSEANAPVLERVTFEIAGYIAKNIKVGEMLENKINAFAVDEAESIVLSVVDRELKMITVLGGVLGFIIGLISLIPQIV